MLKMSDVIDLCRVPLLKKFKLKNAPTNWNHQDSKEDFELRREAKRLLETDIHRLSESQQLLYASQSWSVLVILQAIDTAGKDGTIAHVMTGVNPQGVKVVGFRQPSAEELSHNFLWRYWKELPERGRIGIFNRSYYEETLVVQVHPELLANQRIPDANPNDKSFWKARYKDINQFEKHLVRNGTRIVKIFLHLSKAEQKRRLLARMDDPAKNWKFSPNDLSERTHWKEYMSAYEEMLNETNTKHAPWYVIPADEKMTAHLLAAHLLSSEIQSLGLKFPALTLNQHEALVECRAKLEAEVD